MVLLAQVPIKMGGSDRVDAAPSSCVGVRAWIVGGAKRKFEGIGEFN